MALRKEILSNQNIPYHILTRAVDKKQIFKEEEDRLRFMFQMHAANIGKPASNLYRKDIVRAAKSLLVGQEIQSDLIEEKHPPLVSVFSFAEVGNHYHFGLISNAKNSIPTYMQRLNIGFAKYFNLKYGRKGTLFESRYKIVPIQTDFQFDAVLRYINIINPLDIYQPGWREKGLEDEKEALRFLNEYQFSSFPDIFGNRNSKILASRQTIDKFLGREITLSQEDCLKFVKDFLKSRASSNIPELFYLE